MLNMNQLKFNDAMNEWTKDANSRLNNLEKGFNQIEILINNQECDHDTMRMLIDRVEELNEEVRHMRTLQALMADLTRLAIRNQKQNMEELKQ